MANKEVQDIARRCEELENFFKDVSKIFDSHLDRETQGNLNSASSHFQELKLRINQMANGGESLENVERLALGDTIPTGEKAASVTEGIIVEEIKAIKSELEDLE